MEIGIIGLPRSGKTTIFNAVTRGNAAVAGYSDRPNVGVAKVPDERLNTLAKMYKPLRVVPAEVTYNDFPPPPEGFGETRGIDGDHLNFLQTADALLVVVRAFDDPGIAHVDETIDPIRDAENMLIEMTFSDLEILHRRLGKIELGFKGAKPHERELLARESKLLHRIRQGLDDGIALRDQGLLSDEMKLVSGFGLLSTKPIIMVMNFGEGQLLEQEILERSLVDAFSGKHTRVVAVCAQLEMDLAQMDPNEEETFRSEMGAGESSLNRVVRASYDVVGQISFFTVGKDEVRAWEIRKNTKAQDAAKKIHSDLGRGFIRAEVISHETLVECGGLGEARKRGTLRQEGKEYIVEDGEIMHVLFNV